MVIVRGPFVCPDSIAIKLRYSTSVNLTSAATTVNDTIFRANGPYDPDYAPGGTQPLGYDEWAAFYNKTVVLGSKIDVVFISSSDTSGTSDIQCSIYASTDPTAITSPQQMSEFPYSKTRFMGLQSGGRPSVRIKQYLSSSKILGVSNNAIVTDDIYQANTFAVPSKEWYWHVFNADLDGSNNLDGKVKVMITYYVKWFDRVQLSRS